MTPEQLDSVPTRLLRPNRRHRGCFELMEWLAARGLTMTLLELEEERKRRGFGARR